MQKLNRDLIIKYLNSLGLNDEESEVYKALLKSDLTILDLSRQTGIERTKLYSVTEKLRKQGLIEEVIDYKKKFLSVGSPERLKFLVDEQVNRAQFLTGAYGSFIELADSMQSYASPSIVKYYRGKEGLKQIMWNQLNAKEEILTFAYRSFARLLSRKFIYSWIKEFTQRDLRIKELRSIEFLKSYVGLKPFNIKGIEKRYIDHEVLNIVTEITIYGDTSVIFNWREDEIFGLEIKNQELAQMQKQIFNSYWERAEKWENKEAFKKLS